MVLDSPMLDAASLSSIPFPIVIALHSQLKEFKLAISDLIELLSMSPMSALHVSILVLASLRITGANQSTIFIMTLL